MTEFITLTFISLLMIISPGPDFAMITRTSLGLGRRAGVGAAFGIALANLAHVAINILGLGILIAKSMFAFSILKILGALYLIYIGVKGLRARSERVNLSSPNLKEFSKNVVPKSPKLLHQGLSTGFLTCILNPKAALFFLSFFSVILSPNTPLPIQISYGMWIASLALIWFCLVAFFFTHPFISETLSNVKHWIERIAGAALILLGIHLLASQKI